MECIQPTKLDLKRGHIIQYHVSDGAALRVARRNINNIVKMHGNCAVLNGAENLKRLCDDLQLTDTISEIFRGGTEASASKRKEEEGNIIGGAAAAATKLEEKHRKVIL